MVRVSASPISLKYRTNGSRDTGAFLSCCRIALVQAQLKKVGSKQQFSQPLFFSDATQKNYRTPLYGRCLLFRTGFRGHLIIRF